ncbi:ABC transporter G family member 45 [Canna indica]|uniref:ABC transporter G family member 45 n=1 Tax=Canna indica TaxID=4628 RepID=A0AAQ3QNF5_9LILI|nr:ABC transporter G family member 45 [Canna indica]
MDMQEAPFTHEDNEEFLLFIRERMIKLGIEAHKVEVRFENLSVEANMQMKGRPLPTLFNVCLYTLQEILGLTSKRPIKILNGLKGIIRPSRMTLVLGPPGSGKSTFLKALSGKLEPGLKFRGRVTYNGEEVSDSMPHYLSAYIGQHDLHHAEMTVRETLDFSAHIFGTNDAFGMLSEPVGRKKTSVNEIDSRVDVFAKATTCGEGRNSIANYVIKLLGLDECADITVGDEMRRGISGGQKKRVTIGELLVSLSRIFFMDDISNGLDSSTTFEIVNFLRQMAHLMDLTMVISLLQPSPETFELFDDIILLCKGQILYQGPREHVLEFFEILGFKCPDRKNTADFLEEVISEFDQAQYWSGNQSDHQYISTQRIAELFHTFNVGQLLEDELCMPNDMWKNKSRMQLGYKMSKWGVFKACFSRELLLLKRNSPLHIFKTLQIIVLGILILTLFFKTEINHDTVTDANKFLAALSLGLTITMFNSMTELAIMVRRLPILYKQRQSLSLPGWSQLSPIFILSLPISLVEISIWTCLTYFFVGYAPSAIRFFQHLLTLFCMYQMTMSLFRLIAVLGRTQVKANVLGTMLVTAIYILGGTVISKDSIKPWLKWAYWASPLTYAQNAVALNEFLDKRWSMKFQYQYLDVDTVGKAILKARGIPTEWHWFWICIAALISFCIIFNLLSVFAFAFLKPPQMHQAIININQRVVNQTKAAKQSVKRIVPRPETLLHFQKLTITFSHINYYIDMPAEVKKNGENGKRLQLLQDVSGSFRPGILTAVMGVSGAGKTTLLDVLAGRKTGGCIEGNISISGYPKKQETFARVLGYCEQTDIHSPYITVYESLQYSAWLRLPSNVSIHARNVFVEEVMDLIELTPLKDAIVGLPGSGLSAEQRKRLTIAVELVSSPSIIFLDEPTSSMDAQAAYIIMRAMRKTVDTGCTVVCTIHQPSIRLFESFDELLLMKRGGQLIYSGPLGPLCQTMIQYFEAIPGVPKIRKDQNPAAWMLDITSLCTEHNKCINYAEIFRNSSLYRENMELIHELSKIQPNSEDLHFSSGYQQSLLQQCIACLWKLHRSYWKNPELNVVRFITTIVTSILFGIVFWKIGSNITSEQDIFNILGVMYASALFQGFVNANLMQPVVWMERAVLYRERLAVMYTSMAYAIAQVAIEIPYVTVQALLFSFTLYPMIGFQFSIVKFLWFILFILLSLTYFTLYGMMVVALTPTPEISALLSFLIYLLWIFFSGFFITRKMIPVWWRWLYWANPAAWTIYGLMYSQLGDLVEPIHVPGEVDQPMNVFLRDIFGFEDDYFTIIVALHFGVIMLFMFVFGFGIKHLNFQKR